MSRYRRNDGVVASILFFFLALVVVFVNIALWGVVIWAIVKLVQHVTG